MTMYDGLKMVIRMTYSLNSAFTTIRDNYPTYYPTSIGIMLVAAAVVSLATIAPLIFMITAVLHNPMLSDVLMPFS